MSDLAWTETISEDVEQSLPPAVRRALVALRKLHVAEREDGS